MKIDLINIRTSFTKFADNQMMNFTNARNNCIFIYGSNGSGKSSISKLFSVSNMMIDSNIVYKDRLSLLKTIDSKDRMLVEVCYSDDTFTTYGDEILNPKKIPVFNKDYIDSKITYQSDFKNNRFQEQILNYGIELESKTNYNKKLIEVDKTRKRGNELVEQIEQKIAKGILQTIKDTGTTRANQKYNNEYNLKHFYTLDSKKIPINNLEKLREQHKQYVSSLKNFSNDDIIQFSIDEFNDKQALKNVIVRINDTLKFSEDKSKLDFVKKYLDNFETVEKDWKIQGANLIKDNKCPFCEQNISNVNLVQMYKNYVNSNLRKTEDFINNQIQYFKSINNNVDIQYKINETKVKNISLIFKINLDIQTNDCVNRLKIFNSQIIKSLESKLEEENIYNDCSDKIGKIDLDIFEELFENYTQLLKTIRDTNDKINKSSAERKKANEEYLNTTGKFIVYNMVRNEIEEFKLLTKKSKELEKDVTELKQIYQNEIKEKNELLKTINNILDDFSITNYRVDENFDLFLNNCEVSQKAEKLLSDGEKNIIALALFVAELRLLYTEKEKSIIFIDDPITSVDYPNLYGIYSYITNIVSENKTSQIIITSHNVLFLNLFKFHYSDQALYFKLKVEGDLKTRIYLDDKKYDSIYLEKLKEIYDVAISNNITSNQKLYIHNYCRYVIETISRFEYPNNQNESKSSEVYIKNLKQQIIDDPKSLNVSINNLDTLYNIINKGSHATIEVVHDNEFFEDSHYIKCCKTIIEIIRKKYNGQFQFLTLELPKNGKISFAEQK